MRDNGNGKLLVDWRVFTVIITVLIGSVCWALSAEHTKGVYQERVDHNTAAIAQVQEDIEAIRASQQRGEIWQAKIAAKLGVDLD